VIVSRRLRIGDDAGTALTPTQRLALGIVVDTGPLRLGGLADALGTTDATATRTVDALAALGLAERARDPLDRRGVRVGPTGAGRELIARRRAELASALRGGLADMAADDHDRLVGLLAALTDALAASAPATAHPQAPGSDGSARIEIRSGVSPTTRNPSRA
jgi:DNA-binding MarR family transcriptional regulator